MQKLLKILATCTYRQSKRLDNYLKHAEKLIESGMAYYCFLTDEQISEQKEKAKLSGGSYQVKSPYRECLLAKLKKN